MKTMWLFLALAAGTISGQVRASEELEQAEIRRLVSAGEVLPLEALLARFPPDEYGKLLDLEVERERDVIVYELEFLLGDGRIVEIEVDARTGEILGREFEE